MRGAASRALLACVALLGLGVSRPPGLADVVDIRHWSYRDYTRVVVELSRSADPELHRLGRDTRVGRPPRLYLDLPGVWVGRRYGDPIPVGDGLLHGVRVGQNTLRKTRVVLDLKHYTHHRLLRLTGPDRIVLDVYGERRQDSEARHRMPVEMRGVRKVVLDAGHGGRDPGARGVGGLTEKHVTLSLARKVRERLVRQGFEVVMTRDADRTVSLEERTAIAEGVGGDVFVSLHVNAARRRGAQGIETYYLNAGHERHTLRVAARENGVSRSEVDVLQRTLAGLRVSEISQHGARLAGLVQGEMVRRIRADYGRVTDLGVKQGPFYVLFLSNVPSVLVEMGFLTNPTEAKRLRQRAYLDAVADAVTAGLVRYRDTLEPRVAGRPR